MKSKGLAWGLVAVALLGACSGGKTTAMSNGSGGDASPSVGDVASVGGAKGGVDGVGGAVVGTAGTGGQANRKPFVAPHGCSTDADCTSGACRRFGKDGPGRCLGSAPSITQCAGGAGSDVAPQECCSNDDCAVGRCVAITSSPITCSLTAGFDTRNRCVVDKCQSDADCPVDNVCTPEGFDSARGCISSTCHSDADCKAEPDGVCAVLALGCCRDVAYASRGTQLGCVYPSDGCEADNDCASRESCVVTAGRAHCSASCP
jgi:hypothetical protein